MLRVYRVDMSAECTIQANVKDGITEVRIGRKKVVPNGQYLMRFSHGRDLTVFTGVLHHKSDVPISLTDPATIMVSVETPSGWQSMSTKDFASRMVKRQRGPVTF